MAYGEHVQRMLDDTARSSAEMEGFENEPAGVVAEPILVRNFNNWVDPWNPLYNDPEYARSTKYGRSLAFPMFAESMISSIGMPRIVPEGGFAFCMYAGENFELFKPVYPGERYKVFHRPTVFNDITNIDRRIDPEYKSWMSDRPVFSYVEVDADVLDENDELVARHQHLCDCIVLPGLHVNDTTKLPYKDHYYTDDEWDYIESVFQNEEIRGPKPRYWEDVSVGDVLAPVSLGPTTLWEALSYMAMRREASFIPMRRVREAEPGQILPVMDEFNNYRHITMWHYDKGSAMVGGAPGPFMFGNAARMQITRLISNWMGDNGEIRALKWRHHKVTQIGDCSLAAGKVVGKKVENGECLVEIDAYLDNLCRGSISESSRAWVRLPSRSRLESTETASLKYPEFQPGDRITVKDRTDNCLPSGYPLAGAEGIVLAGIYPWQLVYHDYDGYVSVKITKSETPLGIGDRLVFRADELEKRV